MNAPQNPNSSDLDCYVREHKKLCLEIAKLNSGDSSLVVQVQKYSGGVIPEGEDRISEMLENRLVRLSGLEVQIEEYCRISGVKNPIPTARRV